MVHLPVFTLCLEKWPFYCVQQVCQIPSEFDNFSTYMLKEGCNETFTSPSPPNLALRVVTVPCRASNNLRACQARSLSKVKHQNQSKIKACGSVQMFEVLSISSHTGVQPSMPLVDGLIDNTLLQTRQCGNQALHRLLPSST